MRVASSGNPRAGYPRANRLRRRAEFQRVQRGGRRLAYRSLVVLYLPNERDHARFGLVVSRRVGNAVRRNRVKRWLREAIRHHRHGLTGVDVVFIARSHAATAGLPALEQQVAEALETLRDSSL